jgi:flavin-dependent dehydrogenase
MFSGLHSFDVIIVGAGPAGAICASALARNGVRVGLVHRAGCQFRGVQLVSGRARRLLDQHSPDFFVREVPALEINETISLWSTPQPVTWNRMLNPWGAAVAVERTVLDQALRATAERAGALIIEGQIRGAERRGSAWQLLLHENGTRRVLKTSFLILANGSSGRRLINRKMIGKPAQFALMAQVSTRALEQRHALYLELVKDGWWYMLPNPAGGYFAGFCTDHARASLKKPLRDEFVKELRGSRLLRDVLNDTSLDAAVTACVTGPRRYKQVAGDTWMAIGDAAFTPDPLSGEGIEFAIESSLLAVQALVAGEQSPALANYEDQIQQYAASHVQIRDTYLASGALEAA